MATKRTVRAGDTFSSIAQELNLDASLLAQANKNINQLRPGLVINVPEPPPNPAVDVKDPLFKINDTLYYMPDFGSIFKSLNLFQPNVGYQPERYPPTMNPNIPPGMGTPQEFQVNTPPGTAQNVRDAWMNNPYYGTKYTNYPVFLNTISDAYYNKSPRYYLEDYVNQQDNAQPKYGDWPQLYSDGYLNREQSREKTLLGLDTGESYYSYKSRGGAGGAFSPFRPGSESGYFVGGPERYGAGRKWSGPVSTQAARLMGL